MTFELTKRELQMLVLSLANCIATCKTHRGKKAEPACAECDTARKLQRKIEKRLAA